MTQLTPTLPPFVHFIRAAAARLAPHRNLRLPLPSADDLRDVPGFIRRCFRRLALTLELPWALVLDNMQELGPAPLLHVGIAASLAELPQQARLIIISREPPAPAYARALAGQQLAVIEATSLRFTDAETKQLVTLHGRDWQPGALRQATDGWAAAMILMLAARNEQDSDTALHRRTARDRLFAFFATEVLQSMAPAHTEALMRIAYLPSATAVTAIAISGDAQAPDLLADLARRSLFTDRREGTAPSYTFNALFGEFLRTRAADRLDAPALRALRVKAAHVLAALVHLDTASPLTAPVADLAERMLDEPLGASQRLLLGSLAYYLLWNGQTVRLDCILIKIDRMCTAQSMAGATLLRWYGVGVLVRSLLGRIDEALEQAKRALALAVADEGTGSLPGALYVAAPTPAHSAMRAKAHLLMVIAALAARDSTLARAYLREAANVLDVSNPIDITTYEFQSSLLLLLEGDWGGAARLMHAAVGSGRASGWPLAASRTYRAARRGPSRAAARRRAQPERGDLLD